MRTRLFMLVVVIATGVEESRSHLYLRAVQMRTRLFMLVVVIATGVVFLSQAASAQTGSRTQSPAALTGQVTSAEEGPMEGVLVTAKKTNSTIAITVVSDAQGHYRFPSAKLEPGQYAISIRAVGYDLESPAAT